MLNQIGKSLTKLVKAQTNWQTLDQTGKSWTPDCQKLDQICKITTKLAKAWPNWQNYHKIGKSSTKLAKAWANWQKFFLWTFFGVQMLTLTFLLFLLVIITVMVGVYEWTRQSFGVLMSHCQSKMVSSTNIKCVYLSLYLHVFLYLCLHLRGFEVLINEHDSPLVYSRLNIRQRLPAVQTV